VLGRSASSSHSRAQRYRTEAAQVLDLEARILRPVQEFVSYGPFKNLMNGVDEWLGVSGVAGSAGNSGNI